MRRISTATKVTDKFGAGKHGFTNGNAVGGVPATDLEDVWFDHMQEEIANVVEWAGITLDGSNRAQLLAALQKIGQAAGMSVANDTGTANTYVIALSPAPAARADGMPVWFKAKTANTGASTLNDGLGAVPLLGYGHAALQGGEIVANGRCLAVWRADVSSYVLVACTGGAMPAAAATQSAHVVTLGQFLSQLGAAGYIKIPSLPRPVILQWGAITTSASADASFTFPLTFPTAYRTGVASYQNNSGSTAVVAALGANGPSAVGVGAYAASTGARLAAQINVWVLGD